MLRETSRTNRHQIAATIACCVIALGTAAAWGGSRQAAAAGPSTDNAVFVGGTLIMRVQIRSGGYSRAERASAIQARVNQLLGAGPIKPADITVEPAGNEATVNVKGQLLFTADWATARFNHSTPTDLANVWADNMRRILPKLTAPK